jgi:hypothetical protein
MVKIEHSLLLLGFCISAASAGSAYAAGEPVVSKPSRAQAPKDLEGIWDAAKYIGLDEVKPGMEAYCLTDYGDAGIEKFGLEVVDVVYNSDPGRDVILVKGTDERFIRTGPVAGCSGSPVYIDGRLAGALAFTWTYAKEPLYGATPIGEMLRIGIGPQAESSGQGAEPVGHVFDFSTPIDLAAVERQMTETLRRRSRGLRVAGSLPLPVITSGLPAQVCEQLSDVIEPSGFMVVAGGGGGRGNVEDGEKVQLEPGACLAVPWLSGDMTASTYGTVTDVVGDKVYGFGHFLLGYGRVDLPIATGKVHTVVSNIASSFKLASVAETVGALRIDEAAGVIGQIGAAAKTIALTIRVNRYNDTEERVYNCRLADNRLYTPMYLRAAVSGAALYLGDFPPDHMIEYKVAIGIEDAESITFENVSTDLGLNELIIESYSSVGLLMNNPYKEVDIESIDFDIRIVPRSIVSHIWSVDLSDSKAKPGEDIEIGVVVESVLAGKKKYHCSLKIPEDLAPGKYQLTVCGSRDYEQFLTKAAPHRFVTQSLPGLIDALNNSLGITRDKLYCILALPSRGVTVEKAELPDLPATKALVLQDGKRALKIQPYSHWIEKSLKTGTVVIDNKTLNITVEK